MRIGLFAVGRLKAGPEKDLAARYLDRFAKAGPAIGLELSRVVEVNESRASNSDTRKREEAAQLEKALTDGSLLVLLDERGKALDSEGFASLLGSFRDSGKRDLMIAIGGADGLDPEPSFARRRRAQSRQDDLAASAGAHSDRRTALSRRDHPFRTSLSPCLRRAMHRR